MCPTPRATRRCGRRCCRRCAPASCRRLSARHPDPAAIASFLGSIEGSLDRAATAHPNPGRVPLIHRLNRTEYRNAIRDLLAVDDLPKEMDISLLLPPDEIGEGFDNMADALFVSPSLIERYVGAARKISRLAVGDLAVPRMIDTYQLSGQLPQDVHLEELPLGTRGGVLIRRTFPVDGEYTFDVQVARGGVYDPSTAGEGVRARAHRRRRAGAVVHGGRRQPAAGDQRQGRRGGGGGAASGAHRRDGGAARYRCRVSPEGGARRSRRWSRRTVRGRGVESAAVSSVTISGPEKITGVGNTPSRQRIFVCRPAESASAPAARQAADGDAACAEPDPVGPRAPRLPPSRDRRRRRAAAAVLRPKAGRKADSTIGIKRALERLLVSPEFLFRIEFDPGDVRPDALYQDFAISSSRHGCRSSSGAASRTMSCSIWRRAARCTRRRCSSSRCGG